MAFSLVEKGFPYEDVFFNWSFPKVIYFFSVSTKLDLRKLQAISGTISASIASLFKKSNHTEYNNTLDNEMIKIGEAIDLLPIDIPTPKKAAMSFDEISNTFKDWQQIKRNPVRE